MAPTSLLTRTSEQITPSPQYTRYNMSIPDFFPRCLMYATMLGTEIHRHERPQDAIFRTMALSEFSLLTHEKKWKMQRKTPSKHFANVAELQLEKSQRYTWRRIPKT